MPKLFVMVGLPGSGKSTTVEELKIIHKAETFSSDEYRKIVCGDENCQDRNQEVFSRLYKDLRIALSSGYNCIFDATNTNRKMRARIFNQIKGIEGVEVIAYVMRTPYEVCVERDSHRERCVGPEVIKKFLHSFEFPQKFEGFSQIIIDNFPVEDPSYDYMIATPHFFEILDEMKEWDQENPHHIHNLYDHCFILADQFPEDSSHFWAGILHDVGKLLTRHYDDQGIAHYFNHDCVGTYFILSDLIDFFCTEVDQSFIEHLLFLVNYHMRGHKDYRGNNESKYRQLFGDDWYNDLIAFANADIFASGTEIIHDKLMKWIKVDKLTLDEIRNKEEFQALING